MFRSVLLMILTTTGAAAQTVVGGPVLADTTWDTAGGPYLVGSSVLVGGGATLTIEAGTEIRFGPATGLVVGSLSFGVGTLIVNGTPDSPVLFTSAKPSLTEPPVPAQPGDWNSIVFSEFAIDATYASTPDRSYTGGSKIEHAIIEFGGSIDAFGSIVIDDSSPYIANNIIRLSLQAGLRATLPTITEFRMVDNFFDRNGGPTTSIGGGASILTGTGHFIHNNLFVANQAVSGGGLHVTNVTDATVSNNEFFNNTAFSLGGGTFIAASSNLLFANNLFSGNSAGSYGGATVGSAGGVSQDNTYDSNEASQSYGGARIIIDEIRNDVFTNNVAGFGYGGGEILATVVDNILVEDNTASREVGGLAIRGGDTTVSNSVFRGNRSLSPNEFAGGLWAGASRMTIEDCLFENNTARGDGGNLYVSSTATFDRCEIREGEAGPLGGSTGRGGGIFVADPDWIVRDSRITDNRATVAGGGIFVTSQARNGSLAGSDNNTIFNTIARNEAPEGRAIYYDIAFEPDGSRDLPASGVCWETTDFQEIDARIYDFFDNSARSIVGWFPIANCPGPCPVDLNNDGTTNIFDIIDFLVLWNAQSPGSDFNTSGTVDIFDIIDFLTAWDAGCP